MVDFYWLKSFTEIIQLFISVFFIIYLKVKFGRPTVQLLWLTVFFYIKTATDLYGILNYTSWISAILTQPVLGFYRTAMGTFELAMLTSFTLFVLATKGINPNLRQIFPYFTVAVLLFPINWLLQFYFDSDLLVVFEIVKIIWIVTMIHLTINVINEKQLRILAYSILLWNLIWLTEVVLHQHLHLISEPTSWVMFVIGELVLTAGLVSYLIQIIANPRLLRFELPDYILPESLRKLIKKSLDRVLHEKKVYRDPDLTVGTLAKQLNVPTTDLTLYLNRILKKNFNQFITEYRIEESKLLLADPASQGLAIEQIMFSVGFKSKSVFNTAFKNESGKTPSEFRKLASKTRL
ncbi:helix-turn-helix domain-containing protein [Ekhidna sp.]